jgi:glutamine amidotransferase
MIGIIDYGSGNLRSVSKAFEHVGANVRLVSKPEEFDKLAAVVLPGVGSFGDCVRNLREARLWDPVGEWLESGKPFLGICLGYQLLFESSEESPGVQGFGRFKGSVVRFPSDAGLKVPHMGWNTIELSKPGCPLWRGLSADPYVYFVHSYFPVPASPEIVAGRCTYGQSFAAAIWDTNIMAVQFHPEKSQDAGLAMLRNFRNTFE